MEVQEYLDYLRDYTAEQLEAVKHVRETYDMMTFEQWKFLLTQSGVVKRFIKLKRPRTLWVDSEGSIWYLNHVNKAYECSGKFTNIEL